MAALTQDVLRNSPWRASLPLASGIWLLVAFTCIVFWPTLSALARMWIDIADYQHGWLIAVIACVLLGRAAKRIDVRDARPMPRVLPMLALVLLIWMVAWRANSDMLQQVLFPIVLFLSILAAFGNKVARKAAFPIAYFYFAIPIWDHFVPLLQWLTTQAAETAMGLLGVPTQVEGHHVTIPAGRFAIIEGCSGKRYFVTGLAFAALAGAMQGLRVRRLVVLLAFTAVAAMLTNWLRVSIVIYAGHLSDMQHYLVAVEHKTLGYALYAPLLFAIGWCARRMSTDEQPIAQPLYSLGDAPLRMLVVGAVFPAALLIAAFLFVWAAPVVDDSSVAMRALPLLTGEWQGPLPPSQDWRPQFSGQKDERRASYTDGVTRVEVYANAYGVQSKGHELVFHSNSAMPAETWTQMSSVTASTPLKTVVVSAPLQGRWVIGQAYVVGGRTSSSGALAQLYYGWSALWRPVPSGAIALAARCESDCASAAAAIEKFWAVQGGALVAAVPDVL